MNRATALKALARSNDVLASLGVSYWLDCGSLLGAVRESDIMGHDLDVDFSCWDVDRHEEIDAAMRKAGFEPYLTHGTPELGYEQRYTWRGVRVDIFYFYEGTVADGARVEAEGWCWQGSWDKERLIVSQFPRDIVASTVPLTFQGVTVPVPVEFEAMLVARYDEWWVPRKRWDYRKDPACIIQPAAGGLLAEVTFLLKSFLRPRATLRAVDSIRRTYGALPRILVVDDSDQPQSFQESLARKDARLLRLPYDSGLSAGRNAGVAEVATTYTVVMDDDMMVTPRTRLPQMLGLLVHGDVVCGSIREGGKVVRWEGFYDFPPDGGLVLVPLGERFRRTSDGIRWAPVEFGLNALVARTEFLRAHPWDERFKLGEHTDWFLSLRQAGAKVVFTPGSVFEHRPERHPAYRQMRRRREFRLRFFHKHGFTYHVGHGGYRDVWTRRDQGALDALLAQEAAYGVGV